MYDAATLAAEVAKRWPADVSFVEVRSHLEMGAERRWPDPAIERDTPCLPGLYSVEEMIGGVFHETSPIAIPMVRGYEGGDGILGCAAGGGPAGRLAFPAC